jgi:uncharacterized protein (TIGR00297 family)
MLDILLTVVIACFLALLTLASVMLRVLTLYASALAAIIGFVLFILGGVAYLALMVIFVVMGALVTSYHLKEKKEKRVSEARGGQRGVKNVLAHAIVPLVLLSLFVLDPALLGPEGAAPFIFMSALAFAAADNFASEIGVLADHARSIVGWEKVPSGTDGGISLIGEMAALCGSALISSIGAAAFILTGTQLALPVVEWVLTCTALGWVGCQLDSVAGATIERRQLVGKSSVNLIAMLATAIIAFVTLGVLNMFGVLA